MAAADSKTTAAEWEIALMTAPFQDGDESIYITCINAFGDFGAKLIFITDGGAATHTCGQRRGVCFRPKVDIAVRSF
jgi:hypothetical protein